MYGQLTNVVKPHKSVPHLFVVMAMSWWYDTFYTLLPYFYMLLVRYLDRQVFSFVI